MYQYPDKITIRVERQENGCYLGTCDEVKEVLAEAETVAEALEQLAVAFLLVQEYKTEQMV